MEQGRSRWAVGTVGTVAALAAWLALPALAVAAGPARVANGEPDNDTQLSVLTPAEAAFMQLKQTLADSIGSAAQGANGGKGQIVQPSYQCEFDPCEGVPPPPPGPPPPATPSSKMLETRPRQQITYYNCGPAAGQVVINYSRGIVVASRSKAGAEDTSINWRKQSTIAGWMKTTTDGTGGANVAVGLNRSDAVLKPVPDWVYSYDNTGSRSNFHNIVVADIATYGMPVVVATAPHQANAGANYLPSWPSEYDGAHHWITVRGYSGLPGSTAPTMSYNDSSGGYGGSTGTFSVLVSVLWQVNDWNQGGHLIW